MIWMTDVTPPEARDELVENFKAARKSPAVLKLRLASFRVDLPDVTVLAFEGDDDKIVYSQWIRRTNPHLRYEAFPCGGKKEVLQLKEVIDRDMGELDKNIYFFIDHDFDGLDVPDERVFMTERYSVENYLVAEDVLIETLKNEYHCHLRPDVRDKIKCIFQATYSEFLSLTSPINFRIFAARRLKIRLAKPLPDKIGAIAKVGLDEVSPSATAAQEVVVLTSEPTDDQWQALEVEFTKLHPPSHYRGKFAIKFFSTWLDKLAEEYDCNQSKVFEDFERKSRVRRSEVTLGNLASKSSLPSGLPEFLQRISVQ
jgi:hypothetical protein